MLRVSEQQLESMTAPRQGDGRFGLASAEMQVVFVVGNRLIRGGKVCVDQQMVMSGVRLVYSGRRNTHLLQSEVDRERGRDVRSVLGRDDVNLRALRRGMARSRRRRGLSRLSRAGSAIRHIT